MLALDEALAIAATADRVLCMMYINVMLSFGQTDGTQMNCS